VKFLYVWREITCRFWPEEKLSLARTPLVARQRRSCSGWLRKFPAFSNANGKKTLSNSIMRTCQHFHAPTRKCGNSTCTGALAPREFRLRTRRVYVCRWSRKVCELTIIQYQKRVARRERGKLFLWRVEPCIRKLKGSMVDRDTGFGAENLMRSNRLIRAHVHR